ncbi:hypothetical protein GCM10027060_14140 [Nesterenkonia halophila]
MDSVPAASAALRGALDRITRACTTTPEVRSAWLEGSLAQGRADAWSDIDLHLAVTNLSTFDPLLWLEELFPLVLADRVPGLHGTCLGVTTDWLQIDVSAHSSGEALHVDVRRHVLLGADEMPLPSDAPATIAQETTALTAQEVRIALYLLGDSIAAVARDDAIQLARTAAALRDQHLIPVMLAEAGHRSALGSKSLGRLLSPEQRHALSALPPLGMSCESLREALLTIGQEYLHRARRVAAREHLIWPTDLEQAAARRWREHLGVDLAPAAG